MKKVVNNGALKGKFTGDVQRGYLHASTLKEPFGLRALQIDFVQVQADLEVCTTRKMQPSTTDSA